jgi:hypothetical protein
MSARDYVKIDTIIGPSHALQVDLYLDKEKGMFFGRIDRERIEAPTKVEAVKKIRETLAGMTSIVWRGVIVLRVDTVKEARRLPEDDCDFQTSTHNDKIMCGASCSFSFYRRERAVNPLDAKRTIEREHPIDFEARCAKILDRAGRSSWDQTLEREHIAALRKQRDGLQHLDQPWSHGVEDFELPYSEEAWEGVRRIAATIVETQAKLDAFVRKTDAKQLAGIGMVAFPLATRMPLVLAALPAVDTPTPRRRARSRT